MTMLRISLTVGLLWVSASALAANGQENARLGRVHMCRRTALKCWGRIR